MSRNVVLVTIDSLRADHCSWWGYDRETTPTLDRMAAEGIAFEDAVAPGPKTPESMPAIFTGEFPVGGTRGSGLTDWKEQVYPHMRARETLPEMFSRRGYTTAGFTPNGFTSRYFGFDAGFDTFEDFLDDEYRPGFDVPNVVRGLFKWIRREGNWKLWEQYYDDVLTWVRQADTPFFLWVFLLDVHSPFLVPSGHRSSNSWPEMVYANYRSDKADESKAVYDRLHSAYEDTIRYADAFLERLEEDLRNRDPAYVVHADHGEAFGEHEQYGHQERLFEENLHVPFVVSNVDRSETISQCVSLRQLPEILQWAGETTGDRSIVEHLDTDSPVFARSREGGRVAVRLDSFKYIRHDGDGVLYDLQQDPRETTDISAERSEMYRFLERFAERHIVADGERQRITRETSPLVSQYPL